MSVRSVVPSTGQLGKGLQAAVLDECQISSSEYSISLVSVNCSVLDECQISSSEYEGTPILSPSRVLDECQISSSEY